MDKICYIVGAGEDCGLDFLPQEGDLVIAADGGYERLLCAEMKPDLVIGDFDSLGYTPEEDQVVVLPAVKDVTDTWAAIEQARSRGYGEFHLYGCTGGRVEHTFANIQTAAALAEHGETCLIFSEKQVITAISSRRIVFSSNAEGFISVFSHSDHCRVSLKGLKYELEDAELTNRFPLGVSNEFIGTQAQICIKEGIAILVYDRKMQACIDKLEFLD